MQEDNRLFQTFFDRLEKLRLGQGWSWDDCAQKIGISKAMLFFMRAKKQNISKKSWFKLEAAERAAGLTPPSIVNPDRKEHFPGETAIIQETERRGELHVPLADLAKERPEVRQMLDLLKDVPRKIEEMVKRLEPSAAQAKALQEVREAITQMKDDMAVIRRDVQLRNGKRGKK